MNSIWKIVPSYPMLEVSSAGDVRYTNEYMQAIEKGRRPAQIRPIKITGFGYAQTKIVPDRNVSAQVTVTVHRLVCEAFHGLPLSSCMKADHVDGDKTNNNADNLRWLSHSANCNISPAAGKRRWFYSGELWLMKRCIEKKIKYSIICKMFNCSTWIIHAVRRGQKDAHIRQLY